MSPLTPAAIDGSAPPVVFAIDKGIAPAIDCVAARAAPRNRFLRASWFAAALAEGAPARTLIGRRADGDAFIALPIAAGAGGIPAVPGCYWPFRSFPIAEDIQPAELAAFFAHKAVRRALGPVWRLGPIPADDPAVAALEQVAGWRVLKRRVATGFVLDMAEAARQGAWPRGSTLRKNRFHEKHLAEHGPLDWRFISGTGWTPAVFDDLAAIEAKSWHAGSDDAKFLNARHRRVWEGLAADPEQVLRMRAAMLYIGGAPAAFSFDLDCGTTKYAIANSYDPGFAKHSPGKCLYYRNLVEAIARGITLVDWGAGDSGYKTTIGAAPGAEIIDCLIVRDGLAGAALARLAGPLWVRSGRR